jgi:hypothetical protein
VQASQDEPASEGASKMSWSQFMNTYEGEGDLYEKRDEYEKYKNSWTSAQLARHDQAASFAGYRIRSWRGSAAKEFVDRAMASPDTPLERVLKELDRDKGYV